MGFDFRQQGIAAAKVGDMKRAQWLLRIATSIEPTDEVVWLWLASVASNRGEAYACLQRVIALDPGNERARQWLRIIEEEVVGATLEEAGSDDPTVELCLERTGEVACRPSAPPVP